MSSKCHQHSSKFRQQHIPVENPNRGWLGFNQGPLSKLTLESVTIHIHIHIHNHMYIYIYRYRCVPKIGCHTKTIVVYLKLGSGQTLVV